jgi:predicted GNAT family acetyltransferase
VFVHTEVPSTLQGRGLAGRLAKAAFEAAQAEGLRVVPLCPFVKSYLAKHPELAPLLAEQRDA